MTIKKGNIMQEHEYRDWELSEELQEAIHNIERYTQTKIAMYSAASFASGALLASLLILFIMWVGTL